MPALSFIGWVYLQFFKNIFKHILYLYLSRKSLKENLKFQKSEKEPEEKKNLR